jgi:hypothetical protein
MTDEEEGAVLLKRAPGGVESLDEKQRERVRRTRDPQLDRALDVLKGIRLFVERAPMDESPKGHAKKVAAAK